MDLAATLALSISPLHNAHAEEDANLTIHIGEIEVPRGEIWIKVCREENFLVSRCAHKHVTPAVPDLRWTVRGIQPGPWAVLAWHDLDGDRSLARRPNMLPAEPVAVSNNIVPMLGPPRFSEASVMLSSGQERSISITAWFNW